MSTLYLHLSGGEFPPILEGFYPYRSIVVIEEKVTTEWQYDVSEWLVESGCRYMLAVGDSSSEWDDSVDVVNLEQYDYGEMPDDALVVTSWHENETFAEVAALAKNSVSHTGLEIENTLLLHISAKEAEYSLLKQYENA